jgi:DNA-binding transcriptional MerR regulator
MRDGLRIGEIASRTGLSRKVLRRYEARGILMPRRTPSGYRLYHTDTVPLLHFVAQARRLGFALEEIKQIVTIGRSGRLPCPHIRELVRRKTAELDRALADMAEIRRGLERLLGTRVGTHKKSDVCPYIEAITNVTNRRKRNGKDHSNDHVALPGLRRVPGGDDRRRRRQDR